MNYKIMLAGLAFAATSMMANEFIGYKALTHQLKAEAKKKW